MDQIELLQQQFMQLQQRKSNPLSDRTLVQLLLKLPNFGLVFYQTTDGNQYITQQYLQQLISQVIQQRGKVLLGNLPQIIGINLDIIQNRLNSVTNKYKIIRIDDKLMSGKYLNSLIEILNEKLEIKGRMNLEQISNEFELPLIYTRKFINQRISQLNAELYNDQIITKQYNDLKLARLKGAMNAVSKPTSITQLIKKLNFDQRNTVQAIQQLINSKQLLGKISHGIYIPQKFQKNQMQMIQNFLSSNNYIDYNMLQKSFYILKPKEWLKTNFGNKIILLEQSAYSFSAIEPSRNSIVSILKNDGYVQTNKIFPSVFTENDIQLLFNQHLKLDNLILKDNYCFDPSWLEKCANQFRQKIIFNIYFKVQEKEKNAKKKSKKQRISLDQMSILYENSLIDYNTLEDIKELLYQILTPKIQELYNKINTQISHSKGIITSNLLKYKKGKTIFNDLEKCNKFLNTLEKQLKKNQKMWKDEEFGQNSDDNNGLLSLIYFDKIVPKQWPSLQKLQWKRIESIFSKATREFKASGSKRSPYLIKSKLLEALQIIQQFNIEFPHKKYAYNFFCPDLANFQKYGINVVKFNIQNEPRFCVVDNQIPFLDKQCFSSYSQDCLWISLIQKAYAKLRYCYKGILNVGFSQVFNQVLGYNCQKKMTDFKSKQSKKTFISELCQNFKDKMIIVGTEGQLNSDILLQNTVTGFKGNKNYLVYQILPLKIGGSEKYLYKFKINEFHDLLHLDPEDTEEETQVYITKQIERGYNFMDFEQLIRIFKNIYIIDRN